jgi:hypothetical protein
LNRANLEGANLQGADLTGANLTHAVLEGATMGGAILVGARLAHADLGETDLSTAKLDGADLTSADLSGANLEEASLVGAQLRDALLSGATLTKANFSSADMRRVGLAKARLDGAIFTAARVNGIIGTGAAVEGVDADWVDDSVDGNGSRKVTGSDVTALLSGQAVAPSVNKRFFGKGDVLRNAHLEFDTGAAVEIESLFEHCTIALGDGSELVIGKSGVLNGCQVKGAGKITIHGKFVERESPGIAGATQLVVSSIGSLVGAVEQSPERTRFAFEPGCHLRMKIHPGKNEGAIQGTTQGKRAR